MTNSWMNADGEPIMDGAAWRFEQQLDMDSAHERYEDDFYAYEPDEVDPETCDHADKSWSTNYDSNEISNVQCDICFTVAVTWVNGEDGPESIAWEPADEADFYVPEDQWLDGSYEE